MREREGQSERASVPLQNRVQEFITQFEIANECVINLELVVVAAFVIVVCIRPAQCHIDPKGSIGSRRLYASIATITLLM